MTCMHDDLLCRLSEQLSGSVLDRSLRDEGKIVLMHYIISGNTLLIARGNLEMAKE